MGLSSSVLSLQKTGDFVDVERKPSPVLKEDVSFLSIFQILTISAVFFFGCG